MTDLSRPSASRWAIILLAGTALALGGCGRKGALDPPPNAPALVEQGDTGAEPPAKADVFDPSYGANDLPKTPKGGKKSFILDPLLNSN
ncbi:MAG TPA: lipoprotein [Bradyrhizobium sp.]|nr:lipoprotein [Bradyrhizobium sp.]